MGFVRLLNGNNLIELPENFYHLMALLKIFNSIYTPSLTVESELKERTEEGENKRRHAANGNKEYRKREAN